jgi:hypothetical protein
MSNLFIFFNIEHEVQFLMGGTLEQANQIINTSGGQLYCRELRDGKLYVCHGPRAGEEGFERLSKQDIYQLKLEDLLQKGFGF